MGSQGICEGSVSSSLSCGPNSPLFKSRLGIYSPNPSYTYTHTCPALRSNLLINNRFHTASADEVKVLARTALALAG